MPIRWSKNRKPKPPLRLNGSTVIPAKAGIHNTKRKMDTCLRRYDTAILRPEFPGPFLLAKMRWLRSGSAGSSKLVFYSEFLSFEFVDLELIRIWVSFFCKYGFFKLMMFLIEVRYTLPHRIVSLFLIHRFKNSSIKIKKSKIPDT